MAEQPKNWNEERKALRPKRKPSDRPQFAPTFLADMDGVREAALAEERVRWEIERLGLQRHRSELDEWGYTVLRPDETGVPPHVIKLIHDKVVAISGQRMGVSVDQETGHSHSNFETPFGQAQWEAALLLEDPIFEQMLMNEAKLSLVTYLLGESCTLNHFSSIVKGPGTEYLPLHTDQNQSSSPAPFPPSAQVANATWALTDYSVANGAICFVRGSQTLCRPPNPEEAIDLSLYRPLEVAAGTETLGMEHCLVPPQESELGCT